MKTRALVLAAVAAAVVSGPAAAGEARGLLLSSQKATLSSTVAAKILEVRDLGARFKKGDVIVRFDCSVARAEAKVAGARLANARRMGKIQDGLWKSGIGNEHDSAQAAAEIATASAEVGLADARLAQCEIKAPFDGQVTDLRLRANEYAQVGAPVIEVGPAAADTVVAMVPAAQRGEWSEGQAVSFVAESGATVGASVVGVVDSTDPVSNTFKIVAKPVGALALPVGTTGKVVR